MELKKLKGVRDYNHEEALLLEKIFITGSELFKLYGFLPLETSNLERWEVLIAKDVNAGEAIKEQTYNFKDKGGKHIGLRFDLTISLIRYIAEHQNINIPFKRYQLGKVYRYEEAKRSRYREFFQLDLDVVGGKSIAYDAELLAIASHFFNKLDLKNHYFLINNRKVAEEFLKKNYPNMDLTKGLRTIDKIDKINKEEFLKEGFKEEHYDLIKSEFKSYGEFAEAISIKCRELEELENYLHLMNVENYRFSLKIVRGLDYYTGNVFETFVKNYEEIGSIGSGGRYDEVFSKIIKRDLPSVGYSFGVDRILDILIKEKEVSSPLQVFIAYTSPKLLNKAIEIREELVKNKITTFLSYDFKNLTNQIKQASRRGIEWLLIVGEKDIALNLLTLRNLITGEEEKIKIHDVPSRIRFSRKREE